MKINKAKQNKALHLGHGIGKTKSAQKRDVRPRSETWLTHWTTKTAKFKLVAHRCKTIQFFFFSFFRSMLCPGRPVKLLLLTIGGGSGRRKRRYTLKGSGALLVFSDGSDVMWFPMQLTTRTSRQLWWLCMTASSRVLYSLALSSLGNKERESWGTREKRLFRWYHPWNNKKKGCPDRRERNA